MVSQIVVRVPLSVHQPLFTGIGLNLKNRNKKVNFKNNPYMFPKKHNFWHHYMTHAS